MSYSYGFKMGHSMGNANEHVVRVAFKRGESERGNQHAWVTNEAIPSNGLYGQAPECTGCKYQLNCIAANHAPLIIKQSEVLPCRQLTGLHCKYHSTTILEVDLPMKRITSHDFGGWRTPSTTRNFDDFVSAARRHLKQVPDWVWNEFDHWTNDDYFGHWYGARSEGARKAIARWIQFFRVPWFDGGWFYWEKFDEELAKQFRESLTVLSTDQLHRYLRCGWTRDGKWSYDFIDADAKRRWLAREKKRERNGQVRRPLHGLSHGAVSDGRDAGVHDGSRERVQRERTG